MLAFFSLIRDRNGEFEISDGTLFNIPIELRDNFRLRSYKYIKKDGWSISEYGYSTLIMPDYNGNRYIIPGLYLTNGPRPNKKFYGYKPIFSKNEVEKYLEHHINRNKLHFEKAEEELTALVHDLRQLSSSIYHSATEARTHVENDDLESVKDSLKTVIATQTMLKVRTDFLDFSGGSNRFDEFERKEIPVYSRVDKVVRCFRAIARSKCISISISGPSYQLANGPNILDIVPYTIIDNAIKYARSNTEIKINVQDTEDKTIVKISSFGPSIESDELKSIFIRGYRGKNAKKERSIGTGIGLSVAKEVIELFGGEIFVHVGDDKNVFRGIDYSEISFVFSLPTRDGKWNRGDRRRRQR